MPKRTVVFDRIGYATGEQVDDPLYPGRKIAVTRDAAKGDVVDLSAAEAERLDALGATAPADADIEPNPPPPMEVPDVEEVRKVAGIADRSAETLPETPQIDAQAVEEAGLAAGVNNPGGIGVELHDNERTENGLPGLAAFLPPSSNVVGQAVDDDTLAGMKADELVAYLNQHNEDVDRVEAAENARPKPRTTVLAAVEAIRAAQATGGNSTTPEE